MPCLYRISSQHRGSATTIEMFRNYRFALIELKNEETAQEAVEKLKDW